MLTRVNAFYNQLRRRNVTKALLLYIGTAWAFIGALDIALPIIGAREELMRVALVIAAVGFFITGFISWFYELTKQGWIKESLRNLDLVQVEASWLQNRSTDYVIIVALVAALLLSLYNNAADSKDLDRTQTLALIDTLTNQDRYTEAYEATKLLADLGVDKVQVDELTAKLTTRVGLVTQPAGADVYYRALDFRADAEWALLGKSPIRDHLLPKGIFEWRIEKEGFVTATRIERNPGFLIGSRDVAEIGNPGFRPEIQIELAEPKGFPVDTVSIPGGSTFATPYIGMGLATKEVAAFSISKFEITNKQFMQFVEAGAYTDASYWDVDFRDESDAIDFESAVTKFVDSTGRPGPSTWSYGKFKPGTEQHPVAGVSWYEARAFAKFVGGDLPSVYQFGRTAFSPNEVNAPLRPLMIKTSNFSSEQEWSTLTRTALGPYGTFDMLGNLREWTVNGQRDSDVKYVLGGSWTEPPYSTMAANRIDAWDRSPANGVRVVFNNDGSQVDSKPIDTFTQQTLDHMTSPTVSDEEFDQHQWAFQAADTALNPAVEETRDSAQWTRKQVSIAIGRSGDRMSLYLYVPKGARPPYQPIIYFPGFTAFAPESLSADSVDTEFPFPDFVLKGGRALVFPVFLGAYERYDGQLSLATEQRRQNQVTRRLAWIREIGRVIDYLEVDDDFDANEVGFLGISFGAARPLPLLAIEQRLKAAILLSGGVSIYDYDEAIPAIGRVMDYITRTTLPVLMINGRYDNITIPIRQETLFRRLGTPEADKKWVVYDTGHWPYPENQMISEVLGWMDKYLGVVEH